MLARGISLFIGIFFSFHSLGQTSSLDSKAVSFNGGFIFGPTLSQIHGDGVGGFDKYGFHLGTVVKMTSRSKNGIQLSLIFNQKGSRDPANIQQGNFSSHRYKLTYFDVPLVYNLNTSFADFQFGLQPSVLISAKESIDKLEYTAFLQPVIHPFDLGVVIGVQKNYGRGSTLFTRITQSIIPISPVPELDLPPGVRWNNKMFNMTLEFGVIILILPHD